MVLIRVSGPTRAGADRAGSQHHADPIVVAVGRGHVERVPAVVDRIGAAGGGRDHAVGHRAVRQRIVHARDRDHLRHVPVQRRKGQAGRRHGAFGGIAGAEIERHLPGRCRQ